MFKVSVKSKNTNTTEHYKTEDCRILSDRVLYIAENEGVQLFIPIENLAYWFLEEIEDNV